MAQRFEEDERIVSQKIRDRVYVWPAMPERDRRGLIYRWKRLPHNYRRDLWNWTVRIYHDEKDVLKEIRDMYGEGVVADARKIHNVRTVSIQEFLDGRD